ncbi:DUF4832 domain-containing protein [Brevibacillus sp. NRS-1366]|uniref:DUF4832 domain-containing protein n=1 Tax=Brevibacillus sp. NRS-1366 TaxID=3233899 RepID=UPI003D1C81D9
MKKLGLYSIFTVLLIITFIVPYSISAVYEPAITYSPKPIPDVLHNPYMGIAPDARSTTIEQGHTLVYANISWRMLEPAKGDYQFDQVEEELQFPKWSSKDVKFIIRIIMDIPEKKSQMEIPDWLYEELDGDGEWYENSYGKGYSPNYSNPLLIAYHKDLITKLGEHYKTDPRIAFVELGSIGHWGEWHTDTSIPFPKLAITDQYVQPYLDNFPDSILLMRRPHPIAKRYKMGLFNDMFGDEKPTGEYFTWIQQGYESWLSKETMPAMPDFWKYAPSGGEFSPSHSLSSYFRDSSIDQLISQAQSTHVSWLGPNTPALFLKDAEQEDNLNLFLNTIGYRFSLSKESHANTVAAGNNLNVTMDWENSGVAPFYFPWTLELSLADQTGKIVAKTATAEDIRKWLPGMTTSSQSLAIPANLPAGEYTLCVGILDPHTQEPAIEFAMEGKRTDLRYTLGKVVVVTK